jgi:two-component system, sporulation sensor kinase E
MASDFDNTADLPHGHRLALLADMAEGLAACDRADELMHSIADHAARVLDADGATLALWNEGGGALEPGASAGAIEVLAGPECLASPAIGREVIRRRQALVTGDPQSDVSSTLDGVTSLAAVPLVSGEQLVGVLVVASRRADRVFDRADLTLLRTVAGLSSSVLTATLGFEQFTHDLRSQIVDVTRELNRAMAELARVKSFNENIFESISMGIVVFDRSFSVVFRNRVADECFPDARNVVDAMARTDVAERYEDYRDIVRDVVRMGQICGFDHLNYPRGEGDDRVLRLSMSPLFSGRESIVGGILTIEDVTRSVDIRQRLEASERLAAVGKLASKVAHELNNPLDGILRYISLASRVAESQDDQRPVEYLKEARTGLMRMARIISELLQFSRSTVQVTEDGDIRTALEDTIKSLEGKAEKAGVSLSLRISDDVPPLQSTALYQVFTNLVKNAVEATPAGGQVVVDALVAAGAVEVRVTDTGPGIPEGKLAAIFEPFFSTKASGQGTGLGLAICKELVEKQGGTLVARNGDEGGAEFVVRIPTQWTARRGNAAGSS